MPHFCSMSGAGRSQLFLVFAFYGVWAWNAAVFLNTSRAGGGKFFSSLVCLLWWIRMECRFFGSMSEARHGKFFLVFVLFVMTNAQGMPRFCSMSGAGRGKFFLVFVICEILNFVNVLGQIYFTDK